MINENQQNKANSMIGPEKESREMVHGRPNSQMASQVSVVLQGQGIGNTNE
uniref:Uncharacterized protein n=1 Tax=Arundo donax TaxID=35708 RepID=A0A0A9BWE8_ARUDO